MRQLIDMEPGVDALESAERRIARERELLQELGLWQGFQGALKFRKRLAESEINARLIGAGPCLYLFYQAGLTDLDPRLYHLPPERLLMGKSDGLLELTFEVDLPDSARAIATEIEAESPGCRLTIKPSTDLANIPWKVVQELRRRGVGDFRLPQIPVDDQPTWESLWTSTGEGIPQLDVPALRELIHQLKPKTLVELAGITSIQFIQLSHPHQAEEIMSQWSEGDISPQFGDKVAEILQGTRGCLLFQEQVMNLLEGLRTVSPQIAYDILITAAKGMITKEQRDTFLGMIQPHSLKRDLWEKLFDDILTASRFAGCQAHHLAKGLTTYQSAYLKRRYPHEFDTVLKAISST